MSRTSLAIVGAACVTLASCAVSATRSNGVEEPSPARTSFFNEGKDVIFGADLRAARITGPEGFLPVQVVLLNRSHQTIALDRESFTLVRPDGATLPVAGPEEFWRDYHRAKPDARMGAPFLEDVFGRYPGPPFRWNDLEFFPEKFSGGVPREAIELRFGEGVYGYLYFRQPGGEGPPPGGPYRLLLAPRRSEVTYVLDVFPYRTHDKKAKAEAR